MYSIIVTIIALVLLSCDISYFVKTLFVRLFGTFERKYNIAESTVYHGICTIRDVDVFLTHMSNARFLRMVNFARQHFYERTGVYSRLPGSIPFVKASTVRYRRPIDLFSRYRIETRMLCWENQTIYLEHKFITLSDNFVRAVALSQNYVVGTDLPKAMAGIQGAENFQTPPEEVTQWCRFLESSRASLRPNNNTKD